MRTTLTIAAVLVSQALIASGPAQASTLRDGAPATPVTQVVDANIATAIRVELASEARPAWLSNGTELVTEAPHVRVRANLDYAFVGTSDASGVDVAIACPSSGAPKVAPATRGMEVSQRLIQTIDFGVPMASETAGWSVVVTHTFKPASI